jgi:hypothetical protein
MTSAEASTSNAFKVISLALPMGIDTIYKPGSNDLSSKYNILSLFRYLLAYNKIILLVYL